MRVPFARSLLPIAMGLGAICSPAFADEASDELEALRKQHQELREFCLTLLKGQKFDELNLPNGDSFKDVTITMILEDKVIFKHSDGDSVFDINEPPKEWASLATVPEDVVKKHVPAPMSDDERPTFRKPAPEISEAIVVIEGDAGVGTGFMVKSDDKLYLYTAAHVLSGNKRLKVKLRSGREIRSFGKFEASEGADLVRIEVTEEVDDALKLGSSSGQARQGLGIYAAGNAGGGGTVGFEQGTVQGIGAESIEINAEVIQGNSGGPIIDSDTHEVLGLVTHLVAARKDQWAKETRYSDIRRFGCRLDREWKWKELPIGKFLKEGQTLKEVSDLNELIVIAIQPKEWDDPNLRNFEDHMVVKEIRSLQDWISKKKYSGTGVSDADQKKRFISLLDGIRSTSRHQIRNFKHGNFVWFHREMAKQSILLRKELIKSCDEAIESIR
ncbi:S1 family peptidase [Haloferula sp.]|uniref:S1 family peptidase n=1 Tax=Haloferula sp. TaxID=2497595 RepID=UPI00329CA156